MARLTAKAVNRAAFEHDFTPSDVDEIRHMRRRLEQTVTGPDLKRGPGGIVDIEFLVQMLQLKHGRRVPEIRTPNTAAGLSALCDYGYLSDTDFEFLFGSYRFLRTLEGRLKLLDFTSGGPTAGGPHRSGQPLAPDALAQPGERWWSISNAIWARRGGGLTGSSIGRGVENCDHQGAVRGFRKTRLGDRFPCRAPIHDRSVHVAAERGLRRIAGWGYFVT